MLGLFAERESFCPLTPHLDLLILGPDVLWTRPWDSAPPGVCPQQRERQAFFVHSNRVGFSERRNCKNAHIHGRGSKSSIRDFQKSNAHTNLHPCVCGSARTFHAQISSFVSPKTSLDAVSLSRRSAKRFVGKFRGALVQAPCTEPMYPKRIQCEKEQLRKVFLPNPSSKHFRNFTNLIQNGLSLKTCPSRASAMASARQNKWERSVDAVRFF